MTILGIDLLVWLLPIAYYAGMLMQKQTEIARKIFLERSRLQRQLAQKMRRQSLGQQKREELPPAHRPENWMRNVHGEPSDDYFILATTGCELTDAIYAEALRKGIDIVAFEKEHEGGV